MTDIELYAKIYCENFGYDQNHKSTNFYVYMVDLHSGKTVVSEWINVDYHDDYQSLKKWLLAADIKNSPDEIISMISSKKAQGPQKNQFNFHSSKFIGFITQNAEDVLAKENKY